MPRSRSSDLAGDSTGVGIQNFKERGTLTSAVLDEEAVRKEERERKKKLREMFTATYANVSQAAYDAYPGLIVWGHARIMDRYAANRDNYSGPLDQGKFEAWAIAYVQAEALRVRQLVKLWEEYREELSDLIRTEYPAISVDDHRHALDDLPYLHTGATTIESLVEFARQEARRKRLGVELVTLYRRLILSAINSNLPRNRGNAPGKYTDLAIDDADLLMEVAALAYEMGSQLLNPGSAKLTTRLYGLAKKHLGYHVSSQKLHHSLVQQFSTSLEKRVGEVFSPDELKEAPLGVC